MTQVTSMDRSAAVCALHEATAIYTAPATARELIPRMTWPRAPGILIEPSCGDGSFLGVALDALAEVHGEVTPALAVSRLEAWEIFGPAAEMARDRIAAWLQGAGNEPDASYEAADRIVHEGDFLTDAPRHSRALAIIGNPPYLRALRIPEPLRSEYARVTRDYAAGDLLESFLDVCADVLLPDATATIGFVTADRWLSNQRARRLRRELGNRGLGIEHVHRLDASSCFYRAKTRRKGTLPRVHPVSVVLGRQAKPLQEDAHHPARVDLPGEPLGAVARVRLAPWLGGRKDGPRLVGSFVVDERRRRDLPEDALVPCADPDDIQDGRFLGSSKWAIRTSPSVEPTGAVRDFILRHRHEMSPRARSRKAWWLPPESWHHWDLSQPSLLVPRITRTTRAVRLPAGVLPIDHGLSVVTRTPDSPWTLDLIEHALAHPDSTAWARSRADPLENDFMSLTTTLLRALPVRFR